MTLGHIGHAATVGVTPDQVRRPDCGWFKSRIGFLPIKAAALHSERLMLHTMESAQMTRHNVPLTHQPGQTMESAQMTRHNVPLTQCPPDSPTRSDNGHNVPLTQCSPDSPTRSAFRVSSTRPWVIALCFFCFCLSHFLL